MHENTAVIDDSKNKHVEIWEYCGENRDKTRVTINNAECTVYDEVGNFTVNRISIEQYTDRFYLKKIVTQFGTRYILAVKTHHRKNGEADIPSLLDWHISIWESVYWELVAANIFRVEQAA